VLYSVSRDIIAMSDDSYEFILVIPLLNYIYLLFELFLIPSFYSTLRIYYYNIPVNSFLRFLFIYGIVYAISFAYGMAYYISELHS
jgi:hypothetical protein